MQNIKRLYNAMDLAIFPAPKFLRMRHCALLILCVLTSLSALATHNRSGEITYRHISGNEYEITIATCTKISAPADRQWLQIDWGDGSIDGELDSLERRNDLTEEFADIDSRRNFYIGRHVYPGVGSYILQVEDPNRNQGIVNIGGNLSQSVPFYIESELKITFLTGHNNSVVLTNAPKERGCVGSPFVHNPGAFDPDGDRLVYSLIASRQEGGAAIPNYVFPDQVMPSADNIMTIDPDLGTLEWDSPPQAGEYNVAILIEEFRGDIKVGSVVRDLQIPINVCNIVPPIIEPLADTCLLAGTALDFNVVAFDPEGGNFTLTADGPMFDTEFVENLATFNQNNFAFNWQPNCTEVRSLPYILLFKAVKSEPGNSEVNVTVTEGMLITVIADSVENFVAETNFLDVDLSWDPNDCIVGFSEEDQEDISYKVYRRLGKSGYDPVNCELGIPEGLGYELIGTTEGALATNFTDEGINPATTYSYRIVTCFADGAMSRVSSAVCVELDLQAPTLTNVSVEATDEAAGTNFIKWTSALDLDETQVPGPYFYELYFNEEELPVYTSTTSPTVIWDDNDFTHENVNTTVQNSYALKFYAQGVELAFTNFSTSAFLESAPNDNQITLSVAASTAWTNTSYEWYKETVPMSDVFDLLATTTEPSFVETGLLNNDPHRYYCRTIGSFGNPDIEDPLFNLSQIITTSAYDFTPPCPPELSLESDCETNETVLTWTNPNLLCADDVIAYNVFYKPTLDAEYEFLQFIDGATNTEYTFSTDSTIAGCFYVTALDSLLPGPTSGIAIQNMSDPSNELCADNCPYYFLPDVFTPNGDGSNDVFEPFPYQYIRDIEMHIYNRWGVEVFETTDRDILWDGTDKTSGQIVSSGTYFYVTKVNSITLNGIDTTELKGYVQVLDGKQPSDSGNQ